MDRKFKGTLTWVYVPGPRGKCGKVNQLNRMARMTISDRKREAATCLLLLLVATAACTPRDSEQAPAEEAAAMGVAESPGCPSDAVIEAFLADWRERRPTRAIVPADATIEAALCAQGKIVERLQAELGPIVGYKAGLTSPPAQERFDAQEPVRGVLLRDMLLEAGAEVPADFGARPVFEADLLVVVADEGINAATSEAEVLAHLSQVIPFIELPDLAVAQDEPLNATILTAINVAARLGVMGEPIPVQTTPEFLQSLADMTVRVTDQTGAELAAASGSAVLGHPLNSVLWLMENGIRLGAGDYVSVGSIGPLMPAQSGQTITVRYEGLTGDPMVSVYLR